MNQLTRERLELVGRRLTDRDRDVIAVLERVRIASGSQLRRCVFARDDEAARRAARRELARLVEWRVVERLDRRVGGTAPGSDAWTYAAGITAQRLAGARRGRRPHLPGVAMWAHALAGAETYTRLVEATRATDRTIAVWQGEPASWREATGSFGGRMVLKPDAFVEVAGPGYSDDSFIEIDMASQSTTVIRRKALAYRSYAASGVEQAQRGGVFPRVVFVAASAKRADVIAAVLADLPTDTSRLFAVGTTETAAGLLMGGAS